MQDSPTDEITPTQSNGIGLRNERSLYAALKQWYAQPGDCFEVPLNGYVIDLVRDGQLVEIQTRNFSAIRQKLQTLVQEHRVHLVHPITLEKWVVQVDKKGSTTLSRRKSTSKGRLTDLFEELVRKPELISHANFSIEFPLIQEEEVRCKDGKGSKRRKRESLKDRRLVGVLDSRVFRSNLDFLSFLPPSLPQPFSTKCLAQATGLPLHRCRQITYCLRKMDAIVVTGKRGNELLYEW
ncbi:hypothetical protein [Pontibacter roseus]|uniref:hypothetical protein n=1 Tax=Pontibacter roseus TaxID=336989 RepID=UPI0003774964|nr:hypothetical protein [Pontibacter roseus]